MIDDKDYIWINFLIEQAEQVGYGNLELEIIVKNGKIKVIKAGKEIKTCNVDVDNKHQ